MPSRASATRYARALFDVALKESDPIQIEGDLSSFAQLLSQNAELHNALTNPAIPASAKHHIVDALGKRLQMASPAHKLLLLLADRDRLAVMPDLLEGVTPDDLRAALLKAVTPKPAPKVDLDHVAPIRISVRDAVEQLIGELPRLRRITFRRLTPAAQTVLAAASVLKGRSCTAYPAVGPDVTSAGADFRAIDVDKAHVDKNLVTAPAWPAHPDWLAKFLKVLGTKIEP